VSRREEVEEFLYREALALDERRFRDWLGLFTEDATYEVPVRITREKNAEWELAPTARIFDDTKETLEIRVRRLETDFAWAEQPPSRTRHYVTNVLVEPGEADGEILALSNLLLYRSRGDQPHWDLLSAQRRDTLRATGDGWRIARRWAALDQSTVNAHNLSVFI
jgi:3-phenylpropionate/cinnamic acid dioxygenase small subunit